LDRDVPPDSRKAWIAVHSAAQGQTRQTLSDKISVSTDDGVDRLFREISAESAAPTCSKHETFEMPGIVAVGLEKKRASVDGFTQDA
jgi:hypothetical protein